MKDYEGTPAEMATILLLLEPLALPGRLLTMGVRLTRRAVAGFILSRQADYLMVVQENQPELFQDIDIYFQPEPLPGHVYKQASLMNTGYKHLEVWEILTTGVIKGYLDWPGAEQVMQITHSVSCLDKGEKITEKAYAITSLCPKVGPMALLEANQHQWAIENSVCPPWGAILAHSADTVQGERLEPLAAYHDIARGHQWNNEAPILSCALPL